MTHGEEYEQGVRDGRIEVLEKTVERHERKITALERNTYIILGGIIALELFVPYILETFK